MENKQKMKNFRKVTETTTTRRLAHKFEINLLSYVLLQRRRFHFPMQMKLIVKQIIKANRK